MDQYFMQVNPFYITMTNHGSKKGKVIFDVTIGIYDVFEIFELIGIFMMSLLSKHVNKDHIGLYRDGDLAILKSTSSPEAEKIKKNKLFK